MPTLIVGLGNPGGEYARTRHNLGWWCLDRLERRGRFSRERREGQARVREGAIEGVEVVLARPQTYMNESGRTVLRVVSRVGAAVEDLVVVHDELDIALGRVQLKRGGGHGGHNGVLSLIGSLRSRDFLRVRIGIGRPPAGVDPVDHVLEPFLPDERPVAEEATDRAAEAIVTLLTRGEAEAMGWANRRVGVSEPGR